MQLLNRRRPRPPLLVSLALIAVGCGLLAEPDVALPLESVQMTGRALPGAMAERPTGPHVELLTGSIDGEELEIAMQRHGDGACVVVRLPPESSETCADRLDWLQPGGAFGPIMTLGSGVDGAPAGRPLIVAGLTVPNADAVVAELGSGSVGRATLFPLAPAQVDGFGFVLALPPETGPHALVALDADGAELGRVEYMPSP
jgi:hypothetical protein